LSSKKRKKDEDEDGCCIGCCDTYTGYSNCCPSTWIGALLLWAVRPSGASYSATDPAAPRPSGRAAAALYAAVRHYRATVSPARPPCCPYTPSCSTYAVQALHRHGAVRGTLLTAARLLRCRPGAARRRGFRDPVPALRPRRAHR
jgi:putative membrane protein insertion efficiency factor